MNDSPKTLLAPLPEAFTIPTQLLDQWTKIPAHDKLGVSLTRQDFDHLFIGLLRILDAQSSLSNSLVEWSNGKLDDANFALNDFRRLNIEAQNHVRQLLTAVIASNLSEHRNV